MNNETFDTLACSLGESRARRGALRGLAAAIGIGFTVARFPGSADAKKKGKASV